MAEQGILIKKGTIVTAERRWKGDVRCAGGKIAELGDDLEKATAVGEEVLDATGLHVLPGGVDPHVHMQLPVAGTVSSDDFESGTAAALAGGTTTIIDFVHPERGQNFLEALEDRKEDAAKAVCDYGLHMAVTWWGDETADWMARCVEAGVPSFKIYLAYKNAVGLEDRDVVRTLAAAADLNALVLVHAEHGDMVEYLRDWYFAAGKTEPKYHALSRPPELEGEATHRAAVLAGATGASLYVVHVTCKQSIRAIAEAQRQGWDVHGETCPQYLLLDDSVYDSEGFEGATYVIAPPIRSRDHQPALWEALESGVLELVATDHCPFTMTQKELGRDDFRRIPGGAAGVEHRLSLLHTYGVETGRITLERFVELVSTQPAKRFGLYPKKGAIQEGADADLVLWDAEATAVISAAAQRHRCDRTPYDGFAVKGLAAQVLGAGVTVHSDGELRMGAGVGNFVPRSLS